MAWLSDDVKSSLGEDAFDILDDTLSHGSEGFTQCPSDSDASTADSVIASQSGTKRKLPSDFGFLTEIETQLQLPKKAARKEMLPVSGPHLRVSGPEVVQTLRGHMFGREVAVILCGEAHEDTIDLTRRRGVLDPDYGWKAIASSDQICGFNPDERLGSMTNISLQAAKKWAEGILDQEVDNGVSTAGTILVFASSGRTKGTATLFPAHATRSPKFQLQRGSVMYEYVDTDDQAREFNKRRSKGPVPMEEQDDLIAQRKAERLADSFELFDDWLIRQFESTDTHVEFIQEAPVSAEEVELHIEPHISPAPLADDSLRCMDLDSDEDNDDVEPHLGSGCYLDYLRRQVVTHLPSKSIHGIDPRMLGIAEDENLPEGLRGSFQQPRFQKMSSKDLEVAELDALGSDWARLDQETDVESSCVPSFEAWLGGAADLLYHAQHIKADYSPFLRSCVGSTDSLWRFYEALYFETVPEALAELRIDEDTRPLACIRSLAYRSAKNAPLTRRPLGKCSDHRKPIPVRSLPCDRFLKARNFDAPRTWLSGLSEQLRQAGAQHVVTAAKAFYRRAVSHMLSDLKNNDIQGDNFVAWMRACHRDIFLDIDTTDPAKLLRKESVPSKKHPESNDHEYCLKSMSIPGFYEAFEESASGLQSSHPESGEAHPTGETDTKVSTVRQRMLSKLIIDAFALRSVDLAMILRIANIVSSAPANKPVVVVCYAGRDHTDSVGKFWSSWGLSHIGLPKKGKVGGKKAKDDDEPSCLSFPPYLHDFKKLFPLPPGMKDIALKMAQSEQRRP
jgi:hypothetical protein